LAPLAGTAHNRRVSDGLVVGGRYELKTRLGRGGFGTVWQGHDTTLRRDVAIKLITLGTEDRAVVIERFWREAQSVASLNHPNIVTAHDFGVHDDYAYLVMEMITGGSLADELAARRMAGRRPLSAERVVAIGTQVAAGLAAAHATGLVHRDLKPANLMTVRPTGTLKIVDFGIAHVAELARLTKPGNYLGTLAYASPEQMGAGTVDGRSDLYSLGCLLYELLSDHSPYAAESPAQWIAAHQSATPTPLRTYVPQVPADLDALVHGLLAKDPARRPPNADAVREALLRVRTVPRTAVESVPSPRVAAPAAPVRAPAIASPRPVPLPGRPVAAPRLPPAYYVWQPTPAGWMPVPAVAPPARVATRPGTATAAGALLVVLSVLFVVEALVIASAAVPVGHAASTAFAGVASSAGETVVLTIMFTAIGSGIGAVIAGLLAGSNLRGSRAGRIWTWILGGLSLLFALGRIGATNAAMTAATPSGADLDRPRVVRALRTVRLAIPDWYAHSTRAFDIIASVLLALIIVLLMLPPTSAYVRARRRPR
jgi:serine/threonine-protein kinase